MAELKTQQTGASVEAFLNGISDEQRRTDCWTVLKLIKTATKSEPKIWGGSIVGFGNYHYKYESGREGDWFIAGFSPRKQPLTLYLMAGVERFGGLLSKLGKHKIGKGCLYINRLQDIDLAVLKDLIGKSVEAVTKTQAGK